MSIRDIIRHRVDENHLLLAQPMIAGAPVNRSMFVGPELAPIFLANSYTQDEAYRFGRLRGDLDTFIEGRLITIASDPFSKPKTTYLARVDPPRDEVWDIRSRDPKPAIRVLGCFAETDVFIALCFEYRGNLGGPGSREWRDFRERCKIAWRQLFHPYLPHSGEAISDYVSENFVAV